MGFAKKTGDDGICFCDTVDAEGRERGEEDRLRKMMGQPRALKLRRQLKGFFQEGNLTWGVQGLGRECQEKGTGRKVTGGKKLSGEDEKEGEIRTRGFSST